MSRYSPTQRLVSGATATAAAAVLECRGVACGHSCSAPPTGCPRTWTARSDAAVALGVPATDLTDGCDSVVDFTKGLAAPLGAVLAGSHEFTAGHGGGAAARQLDAAGRYVRRRASMH